MKSTLPFIFLLLFIKPVGDFFGELIRAEKPVFELIQPNKSGVKFQNKLEEDKSNNVLRYEYFYNGGGVAIGDINNDGLDDIYFTGNRVPNKLYLNQGNFKFKDISKLAGVEGKESWTTGVTMADVNGDGWLDIYVCYSGNGNLESMKNQLFINQKDGTFTEEAELFGLADYSNSIQALFFDYDLDGDLDMYLLNHNTNVINEIEFDQARRDRNPLAGDKLYRNDGGKFIDVSKIAGIMGNSMGFGLGIAVADINGDGYPDIYISNDYIEPDYLYINNQNGTFTESLSLYLQHISYFSMGSDISDFNNDGLPDIFTLDMLPEDNRRQKLLYGPENYEQYALMVMKGFYHQNMRNMLHINNGNGTFSEIGQLSGISNTDWSWASFFVDFDNDGWKDLFISNGYYRDYTNRDFLKFRGDYYFSQARAKLPADTLYLVTSMSSTPIPNYVFKNLGNLTFANKSKEWGISTSGFSNGAAYSDLDNDGNIDLVVNNLQGTASIYRNNQNNTGNNNYLQIDLKGEGKNSFGYGAKITVHCGSSLQYYEQQPTRGFQSSMSHRIHFGLGDSKNVDSLIVIWSDGKQETFYGLEGNRLITLNQENASKPNKMKSLVDDEIFIRIKPPISFEHREYGFNDFKRQPLLTKMLSDCGPVISSADVNKNGLVDVFLGGTYGSPGKMYLQVSNGQFIHSQGLDLSLDKEYTDAGAVFFDANGDGLPDLYLASGGYHDYKKDDHRLKDRLYVNQGGGNFKKDPDAVPNIYSSASCVKMADFDGDGHLDLFVGGRVVPGDYPSSPKSILLKNNGMGKFEDVIGTHIPELEFGGMITDAVWTDLNGDSFPDLVVVGEFMPIKVFLNEGGKKFRDATLNFFEEPILGLWSSISIGDFDGDGDMDFIVGNFGLNSQLKASKSEPLILIFDDFDGNGSNDPILTYFTQGKSYPFASRDELLDQMYGLRSKFTTYASYADARLENILSPEQLKNARILKVNELRTIFLENEEGKLVSRNLPIEAQFSPVFAIQVGDFDEDGHLDFILGGNQNSTRLKIGVMDSNFGQLFKGDGKAGFEYVSQKKSGLNFLGDVKSLEKIKVGNIDLLLVGVNNQVLDVYYWNKSNNKNH
jgi:enediyne biosynthesis protein E4